MKFSVQPLEADVIIPEEIVAAIAESKRLVAAAILELDVSLKSALYNESFIHGNKARDFIKKALMEAGHKVVCIHDYSKPEVVPDPVMKTEDKRKLTYDFLSLNYIIRQEIGKAIGFPYRVGDPKSWEIDLFVYANNNNKLFELRTLVTRARERNY